MKKILLPLLLLSLLSSCSSNQMEHIVLDRGNDQYGLVKSINQMNTASETKGNKVFFKVDDITVNKKDAYTYKDIDANDFWNYIVKKQQLDIEDKPLMITGIRYLDTKPMGAEMIYVFDNADNWLVYSYSSIVKKNGEYYSFNYQDGDQILDQQLNNKMPAFAESYYNKYEWPIDKFKEWFKLNSYEWIEPSIAFTSN